MQIETLKEFIAVAQYGSYTGAAKALYISQPTLSKHIASLEKALGHDLFFDTQPLLLTEAGRVVMEYASAIVSQAETMTFQLEKLKAHKPELIRVMDLTFFDFIRNEAAIVKDRVKQHFPNVTFDVVKCKAYQTPVEALLANDLDVGFVFHITDQPFENPDTRGEGYVSLPLFDYTGEFRLGVPKDSPLLNQGELRLKDFVNQRFCVPANSHYAAFVHDFRGLCREEGFLPQVEYVTATSLQDFWTRDYAGGIMMLELTRHRGFTIADSYIADRYKVVRPFGRERTLYVTLTMVTRDEKHGPALSAFISLVEKINAERVDEISRHGGTTARETQENAGDEATDGESSGGDPKRGTASLMESLDAIMREEGSVSAI